MGKYVYTNVCNWCGKKESVTDGGPWDKEEEDAFFKDFCSLKCQSDNEDYKAPTDLKTALEGANYQAKKLKTALERIARMIETRSDHYFDLDDIEDTAKDALK